MKIAISVESTHDLPKELVEKFDISVIPYNVILGDNMYKDGEISMQEVFDFVNSNGKLPKTTAINEFEYTEYFESLKKEYDAVVHIALSSGISSSCSNAIRASKSVKNVFVIDSLSLTTGIGLLAIYARRLANEGLSVEEIVSRVEARKEKVQVSFVVERLDYLFKGGRCNSLQLLGANVFRIRPSIALRDGKMEMDKKFRGAMPSVLAKYCQDVFSEHNTPDREMAFITYSTATEEMLEVVREACKQQGFENIYETHVGITVSCHCGENTLGIIYFNDGGVF